MFIYIPSMRITTVPDVSTTRDLQRTGCCMTYSLIDNEWNLPSNSLLIRQMCSVVTLNKGISSNHEAIDAFRDPQHIIAFRQRDMCWPSEQREEAVMF